jgi:hypothetical protein
MTGDCHVRFCEPEGEIFSGYSPESGRGTVGDNAAISCPRSGAVRRQEATPSERAGSSVGGVRGAGCGRGTYYARIVREQHREAAA